MALNPLLMNSLSPLLAAVAFACGLSAPAAAQDSAKPKPPAVAEPRALDSEIARYCTALAPSEREARAAYQLARLAELEAKVRDEVETLEQKESAARDWVTRREAMLKSAADDVVAIYAKMDAEAAAPQLAAMEESAAAAVLAKLNPRVAGAILAEMQAEKAAKLSSLIAGPAGGEKS